MSVYICHLGYGSHKIVDVRSASSSVANHVFKLTYSSFTIVFKFSIKVKWLQQQRAKTIN